MDSDDEYMVDESDMFGDDDDYKDVEEESEVEDEREVINGDESEDMVELNLASDDSKPELHGKKQEHQFIYYTEEDIMDQVNQCISEVNSVLNLPPTVVRVMLSQFNWISRTLCEKFYEDQDKLFKAVKITDPTSLDELIIQDDSSSELCQICYSSGDMTGLHCGHVYCLACWNAYLTSKVIDDNSDAILCPGHGCNALAEDEVVCRLIEDPVVRSKYMRLVTNSFVQKCPNVTWCMAPDCVYAIRVVKKDSTEVMCKCGATFCMTCGDDIHVPVDCNLMKKWKKNPITGKPTFIKDCPFCNVPIEKDGGCNHMNCKKCREHFCWMCLGKWESHTDYYNCNIYKPDTSDEGMNEETRYELARKRFTFYKDLYQNHMQSLHLEKNLEMKVDEKIKQVRHLITIAEENYFKRTLDVLRECRKTLAYTYVFAFFLKESNQSLIFENNQNDLHKATEELSGYLEHEMTRDNLNSMMRKILDRSRYCKSRRQVLLNHVNEGYYSKLWTFEEYDFSKALFFARYN